MSEAYLNNLLKQISTQGRDPEKNLSEYLESGSSLARNRGDHPVQDTLHYGNPVNPGGVQQHILDQGN